MDSSIESLAWAGFIAAVAAYLVWRLIETIEAIKDTIKDDEE